MDKVIRKNMKLSVEDIKKRVPHRYPYLMLDRIVEIGAGYCVAIKNVTDNECFFQGHFPEQSIMPGTLIAESMAQAAAFVGADNDSIFGVEPEPAPRVGYLAAIDIKFERPVIPGDQLVIKVQHLKTFGELVMFSGEVLVDELVMAKGQFTVLMMKERSSNP